MMSFFHTARAASRALLPAVIAAAASAQTATEFPVPSAGSASREIAAGPDGNLRFPETKSNGIGRIKEIEAISGIGAPPSPSPNLTIPVAASLHGLNASFFHSDVRVFNRSATSPATVTATYRCLTPPCGDSPQTFTLVPREMLVFDDVVSDPNVFAHPESGGAIEFSSSDSLVITSRLYTPSRPLPTSGMGVPGLPESGAPTAAVVTSLSHSADLSKGFRTNVGVYNANDVEQTFTFTLFDTDGREIGQIRKPVPARTPIQINVFTEAGIATDVASAYCVVSGDKGLPLLAYAGVIDNQSQDLAFIQGQANQPFAASGSITVPVAASIHGAGGSFFHTDATVLNTSSSAAAHVTARYRCLSGSCGNATQTFALAPHQMRAFDDISASLFGAAESGGAIQFDSDQPIVVNSRLYTPSRPLPTYGMGVPGLPESSAPIVSVLPSLSHSTNPSRGFRTNVGAYNANDVAQIVTFELFDPVANSLGKASANVSPRTPVQINVFTAASITTDVPDAYCVVSGDRGLPLLTYAGVIDNQSQDLTFIQGEDNSDLVIIVDSANCAGTPAGCDR